MADQLPDLTPSQLVAAEALGVGSTIEHAARLAEVADSTVRRWKKMATFRQAVDDVTRQRLEYFRGLHRRITGQALVRMLKIIKDDSLPAAVHIRACRPFLPAKLDIQDIDADSDEDRRFFDRFKDLTEYVEN